MKTSIGKKQLDVLDIAYKYIQKQQSLRYNDPASPWLWLNAWAPNVLGAKNLRYISGDKYNIPYLVKRGLGNILSLFKYESGYQLRGGNNKSDKPFDTLIVSWCLKTDFDADGNYHDRYFRVSSRETPDALWFLIAKDLSTPGSVDDNVIIFSQAEATLINKTKFFLKLFLPAFLETRLHFRRMQHSLMADTMLAKTFANEVLNVALDIAHIKRVIQPYEAQPFQNQINTLLKQHLPGVQTIGYIHSTLPALPTSLLCRAGCPDQVFVHGYGQAEIMHKHLGWVIRQIHTIPSLRYQKSDLSTFSGWIFLSFDFDQPDLILEAFETFLKAQPSQSMPLLKPRCHPARLTSKAHLALMGQLDALLNKYQDKFLPSSDRLFSVFIGATSAVLEALEKGIEVAHISANPLFETFQSEVWTYINVEQLSPHAFVYRLSRKGAYIELGEGSIPFFVNMLGL